MGAGYSFRSSARAARALTAKPSLCPSLTLKTSFGAGHSGTCINLRAGGSLGLSQALFRSHGPGFGPFHY